MPSRRKPDGARVPALWHRGVANRAPHATYGSARVAARFASRRDHEHGPIGAKPIDPAGQTAMALEHGAKRGPFLRRAPARMVDAEEPRLRSRWQPPHFALEGF